ANETISVTLKNTASTAIGTNQINGGGSKLGAVLAATTNGVTADTVTVSGNGTTKDVTIAANSSAKEYASAINGADGTGVTASARTAAQMELSLGDASSVSFDLDVGGAGGANTLSITNATSVEDIADQINAGSSSIGVSATVSGGKLELVNEKGDNIAVSNYASDGTSETLTIDAYKADGTLTGTALTATADVIVSGNVQINSSSNFTITGATADEALGATGSSLAAVSTVDIGTANGAQDALAIIDSAIAGIDSQRADLGAVQNRMNFTISNLSNVQSNVT
ncbi:flagellin, partial [Shewanella sp. SR43-4]|uniref:flagellin hook IN motif-containing protein n=1 Tax=Shewanella sp. SR43-4 TaxID=2760942 RepID=UPI00182C9913